jgi:hypothetical protein
MAIVMSAVALTRIPKPVVVAPLTASHAADHRPFAHADQLLEAVRGVRRPKMVRRDDNSRRKMQNVRGDSSAGVAAKFNSDDFWRSSGTDN